MSQDTTLSASGLPRDDITRLRRLRMETQSILEEVLGGGERVALIDIPTYENVGDIMIWMGENEYLARANKRVAYVSDQLRYEPSLLRKMVPEGPILMQGGGNFGDVWPEFQLFRERVVKDFPDRKIIQLPQTIFFRSREAAKRANRKLGQHADYTLLVRDTPSLRRAAEQLPDVRTLFCPDMALGWTPTRRRLKRATRRMVILARKDKEAGGELRERLGQFTDESDRVLDWGLTGWAKLMWLSVRIPGRLAKYSRALRSSRAFYPLLTLGYRVNARQNIRAGLATLDPARLVVTDRLHAHVLAGLLGKPHVVLDNNYGKISAIYDDYTHLFSTAEFLSDPAELQATISQKLREPRPMSNGTSEQPESSAPNPA